VNQRLALMHFPNEDPVGKRIKLVVDVGTGASSAADTSLWVTIVGVAPTVRQRNVNEPEADPVAYMPFRSAPATTITLLARTQGDPAALTPLLREEVRAIDSDVPLFAIQTMDQKLAQQRWPFRVFGAMFASFAMIALLLSAIGLYAVTSYSVTQRTLEIGVRMALGAQPVQVLWLFLRRSFLHLGLGLGIGIAGAFGVGKVLGSLLVRTSGRDPVTLITIVVLLAIVACAACLWPARRATLLDPLVALRFK
jgi:putative ABC transport system permease protein